MHAFYFTIMLAGLQKYAQAATVGDLAVEFNAAALSIKDGIVAEGKSASFLCLNGRKHCANIFALQPPQTMA